MNLRNPDLRAMLLQRLDALSDPKYQREVWVLGRMPRPNYYDDFSLAMNDTYDALDGSAGVDPFGAIGDVLWDEQEARSIRRVIDALDAVLDDIGRVDGTAAQAVSHPRWGDVLRAANDAVALLCKFADPGEGLPEDRADLSEGFDDKET